MFTLVFDEIMLKQLKRAAKNTDIKNAITRMLDKIEENGPRAGKLLDSRLHIYEVKQLKPALRLYYRIMQEKSEAYVFLFEMKTSEKKQNETIDMLRSRIRDRRG